VKTLAASDNDKIVGTIELSHRVAEIKKMLIENTSVLHEYRQKPMISAAIQDLRKTLISARVIMRKAMETTFRRTNKFKQPVRSTINDIVVQMGKFGHAIAMAMAMAIPNTNANTTNANGSATAGHTQGSGQTSNGNGNGNGNGNETGSGNGSDDRSRKTGEASDGRASPPLHHGTNNTGSGSGSALPFSSPPPPLFSPSFAHPTVSLQPGQEDCVTADRYFFGYGVKRDFVRAFELYSSAASVGYAPALCALGSMYRNGTGVKSKDSIKAIHFFKRAVEAAANAATAYGLSGNEISEGGGGSGGISFPSADSIASGESLNHLGQMYELGEGVRKNLDQAIEYYQLAANAGHLDAQTNLGYIYQHGSEDDQHFVPVDLEAAAAWYTEAAEKGCAKAQNNLGYLFFTGAIGSLTSNSNNSSDPSSPPKPDYPSAFAWFQRASDQGFCLAQHNLAICYESGRGVGRNEALAIRWYSEAAKQGHAPALSSLGYLDLKQRKFEQAFESLQKAALEFHDAEAFYHLAQMYHHGLFVPKNDPIAVEYYSKAAEQSHPLALLELGHSYFSGRGVVHRDFDRAFQYYKESAIKGEISEAENCLGLMLEEGVGTRQDVEEAKNWYEKAASKGNADALYNLGLLYESGKWSADGGPDERMARKKFEAAMEGGSIQAKTKLESFKINTK